MNPIMDYELREFMLNLGITKIEELHCANGTEYRMLIKRKIAKVVKEFWEQEDALTLTKATEKWRRVLGSSKE